MTIRNVVNEIADVSNWQELGIILGLGAIDIERIASDYEPREYRQRLAETWFTRDPHRSWEKLRRSMTEAAARRSSLVSQRSIPSTPTSPMGRPHIECKCTAICMHNLNRQLLQVPIVIHTCGYVNCDEWNLNIRGLRTLFGDDAARL